MMKITFMGAGSTIFAKNVLGDCMLSQVLHDIDIALYDIDPERLEESYVLICDLNKNCNNNQARVEKYCGVENRKEALRDAQFVINAIQVGGYEPCTVIDFEIPKKYGLRQTIGDTMGVGGIMRALRTIPVLDEFARDMGEVCPDAWFLNYSNPMAMLTGYMQRFTNIKTIGLCHSVQVCSSCLLEALDIKVDGFVDKIAGINHMGWLLDIRDLEGNDLYPLIREKAIAKNKNEKHTDMTRFEYIKYFGYHCTESSEHNAEYNPFFIKSKYPELIEKYNIPLDEYPRRCVEQIEQWKEQKEKLFAGGSVTHERSREYASRIIEAMVTDVPYKIAGNVINTGLITNLPNEACVEVPCMVDAMGIHPTYIGNLPTQLAAMNQTNINAQLLAIEAAVSKKKSDIYRALMLDPHTAAELSIDDIVAMCDEMVAAHQKQGYMKEYH
ncbi:MAG: alpha-glucosidase/alpha-galactosidase [Clostridiales bacterium]|nr:alpha-glucosidase/alpha-galactosidase [Clostridiales bacterium]